jgi:hypothetical protein
MARVARQSVKAYRTQRVRFADPAFVSTRRAGAAFPQQMPTPVVVSRAPEQAPEDKAPQEHTPRPARCSIWTPPVTRS